MDEQHKTASPLGKELEKSIAELDREEEAQRTVEEETQFEDDFKREGAATQIIAEIEGEILFPEPRIALDDVIVAKRARTEFDPVLLEGLAQSLLTKGQIQSIVVTPSKMLIAGERRLRAAKILRDRGHEQYATLWYNETATMSEEDQMILELEENFRRADLSWQDQSKGAARLHEMYVAQRYKWTQEQTAAKLGVSPQHMSKLLNLASKLDSEIIEGAMKFHNIRTYEGAYYSLMRERERGVMAEIGRRADTRQRDKNAVLRQRYMNSFEGLIGVGMGVGVGESHEGIESALPIGLQAREAPSSPSIPSTGVNAPLISDGDGDGVDDSNYIDATEPEDGEKKGEFFDELFAQEGLRYVELGDDDINDDDDDVGDNTGDAIEPSIRRTLGAAVPELASLSQAPKFAASQHIGNMFQAADDESLPTGDHPYKLTLGDCLEILPQIPDNSVHCIVSDPIWGIGLETAKHYKTANLEMHFDDSFSDLIIMIPPIVKELDRILVQDAHIYVFTDPSMLRYWQGEMEKYWDVRSSPLIWDKTSGYAVFSERTYMASYEMCVFATKGTHILNTPMKDIFVHKRPRGEDKQVQTQKPIMLMREFIENSTQPGEIVLDFMCGSGSTVGAAIISGRRGFGIEINSETHNIAKLRCADCMGTYLQLKEFKTPAAGALVDATKRQRSDEEKA